MSLKTFVVSHPKARSPITVKGRTLEEALAKEGLNPEIWKEIPPAGYPYGVQLGDNNEATGNEGN